MKFPITITEKAAAKISASLPDATSVLRFSLKAGGCAGMSYQMDILEQPVGDGPLITQHGARVEIDPMVEMFMLGMQIDYKETLFESGFTFKNPNATASCGCGTSIAF